MIRGIRRLGIVRSLVVTAVTATAVAIALAATRDVISAFLGLRSEVRGHARVVDGDSLVVEGVKIRLKGIDAPELRQTCRRAGVDWRCGEEARARLADLVEGQTLVCTREGEDRNRRVLAYCRAGRIQDVGARLVRDGWAVAYDATYRAEESEATNAQRGLWVSAFERPREWRQKHRADMAE